MGRLYSSELAAPLIVVANKCDLPEARDNLAHLAESSSQGWAGTGHFCCHSQGVRELVQRVEQLVRELQEGRSRCRKGSEETVILGPQRWGAGDEFRIVQEDDAYGGREGLAMRRMDLNNEKPLPVSRT